MLANFNISYIIKAFFRLLSINDDEKVLSMMNLIDMFYYFGQQIGQK